MRPLIERSGAVRCWIEQSPGGQQGVANRFGPDAVLKLAVSDVSSLQH